MHDKHSANVSRISSLVAGFYEQKRPFRIFHGSTNSTRVISFKKDEILDVSMLDRVLSIDKAKQAAIVEPNVPMDKLVKATLKQGLLPPVVMEFPGITVGGGVQGGAGESSSYKWGCFNQTFNWYEMVLGNGELVKVSPTELPDLFYGTAGSYGTLGVMTAGEIRLIPAKKYVQLTFVPVHSFESALSTIDSMAAKRFDFIDGILFSRNSGVIITGTLSNQVSGTMRRFNRARDPWFYLHAENIAAGRSKVSETVPLYDYIFRYDRGAFWVGRYAFEYFRMPFTPFARWMLDRLLRTRKLYRALQESGISQHHIIQDLALPEAKASEFLKFVDASLGIYPLWLCPLKPDSHSPFQSNNLNTSRVINVGVWGSHIASYDKFIAANRLIESKLKALGGKKWFYAHSYYSKEEFWGIYDKPRYDSLRAVYHADTLPNIFDKITVTKRFPIRKKRGLARTMFGLARIRIQE